MIPPDLNRKELRELAPLNVFGLFEEIDDRHYDRSFRDASAADQRELRELQAAFAEDAPLLPDVEPSKGLKRRAIDAVLNERDAEAAPIGRVGPRSAGVSEAPIASQEKKTHLMWRAAAFILSGAVVVLAYFQADAKSDYMVIAEEAMKRENDSQLSKVIDGDIGEYIGNPNCIARTFYPAEAGTDYEGVFATMYHNEKNDSLYLGTLGLPEGDAPYRLVGVDDTGRETNFDVELSGNYAKLSITRTAFSAMAWQIVDGSGLVVMTTTVNTA